MFMSTVYLSPVFVSPVLLPFLLSFDLKLLSPTHRLAHRLLSTHSGSEFKQMKPSSPTAQVVDIATTPETSPANKKQLPSPVKFADLSSAKPTIQHNAGKTNVPDENTSNFNNTSSTSSGASAFTTTSSTTTTTHTINKQANITQPARRRRKKKNVSRDDNYKPKRRGVDPSSMGNIKGKLRMLSDSRNLRFRKLYKKPDPKVMWIFLAMVVTWYCLFKYFGPQHEIIEYKPSTSKFNPRSNTKLNHKNKARVGVSPP